MYWYIISGLVDLDWVNAKDNSILKKYTPVKVKKNSKAIKLFFKIRKE